MAHRPGTHETRSGAEGLQVEICREASAAWMQHCTAASTDQDQALCPLNTDSPACPHRLATAAQTRLSRCPCPAQSHCQTPAQRRGQRSPTRAYCPGNGATAQAGIASKRDYCNTSAPWDMQWQRQAHAGTQHGMNVWPLQPHICPLGICQGLLTILVRQAL